MGIKKWEQIVDNILETIEEEGELTWSKPWIGGRPRNPQSGNTYSGFNILNLNNEMKQKGYSHNLWVTYNQAKKLDGHVKKGSNGTKIIYWNFYEKEIKVEKENEEGEIVEETEVEKIPFIRTYTVFNIEQTTVDVEDLDITITANDDFEPVEQAEQLVKAQPCLDIRHNENRAYYKPKGDYINLPKKKKFKSEQGYYSTLFHELTHWTGGEKRLDRDLNPNKLSNEYSKEELVAELGANFLCSELGIERNIENSSAYIQSWLDKLKDNKRLLINASARASKGVDFLLDNMED